MTLEEYESVKHFNKTSQSIRRNCQGLTKHSGGYHWQYIEE